MSKVNTSNTQADIHPDQQPQQNTRKDIPPAHIGDNSQQYTDQNSQQNIQPSSENQTPDLPPSTSHIYATVVVGILIYGIAKDSLPLLIITCLMTIALLGPWAMKMFLFFIKENFSAKWPKK